MRNAPSLEDLASCRRRSDVCVGSVGHVDCASEYVFAAARSLDGTNWERLRADPITDFWINAIGSSGDTLASTQSGAGVRGAVRLI